MDKTRLAKIQVTKGHHAAVYCVMTKLRRSGDQQGSRSRKGADWQASVERAVGEQASARGQSVKKRTRLHSTFGRPLGKIGSKDRLQLLGEPQSGDRLVELDRRDKPSVPRV